MEQARRLHGIISKSSKKIHKLVGITASLYPNHQYGSTLCGFAFHTRFKDEFTDEPVTCKSCLKIMQMEKEGS